MGVLVAGGLTGLLNQSSAQMVDGSLKFVSGSSNYLNRTPSSAGNRKTWTWSGWIKRSKIGTRQYIFISGITVASDSSYFRIFLQNDDKLMVGSYSYNYILTDALFRDTSAWYHIVVVLDTSNATAADRCISYVNGVRQSTSGESAITENADYGINSTESHNISKDQFLDACLSNITFIDGLALGPGYFGFTDPLTNTWRPKKFRAEGTTANDGTVWSSGTVTGTAANASGSGGWTQVFDGNTANLVYPTDNNGSTKIVLPKPIRFF